MSHVDRYESQDRFALDRALLALHTCPRCRADLKPVALFEDVWGCDSASHPFETWYLPKEEAR